MADAGLIPETATALSAAGGRDLAWEVTKLPLAYNRNLAAEAGAAGRLFRRLE